MCVRVCVWRDVCVCVEGGEVRVGGMSVCVEEEERSVCGERREGEERNMCTVRV